MHPRESLMLSCVGCVCDIIIYIQTDSAAQLYDYIGGLDVSDIADSKAARSQSLNPHYFLSRAR